MKISFKRMLGLAAIGGAIAYARKHGGFKNAFNELKAKASDMLAKKDDLAAKKPTVGNVSGSAYTGSMGGNTGADDFSATGYRR